MIPAGISSEYEGIQRKDYKTVRQQCRNTVNPDHAGSLEKFPGFIEKRSQREQEDSRQRRKIRIPQKMKDYPERPFGICDPERRDICPLFV